MRRVIRWRRGMVSDTDKGLGAQIGSPPQRL